MNPTLAGGTAPSWRRSQCRMRGTPPGCTSWQSNTGCTAFAGREPAGWHVSVSHPSRVPSWDEMRTAREAMTPDEVTMAILFPPRSEYVNVHERCLHLWQIGGDEA